MGLKDQHDPRPPRFLVLKGETKPIQKHYTIRQKLQVSTQGTEGRRLLPAGAGPAKNRGARASARLHLILQIIWDGIKNDRIKQIYYTQWVPPQTYGIQIPQYF